MEKRKLTSLRTVLLRYLLLCGGGCALILVLWWIIFMQLINIGFLLPAVASAQACSEARETVAAVTAETFDSNQISDLCRWAVVQDDTVLQTNMTARQLKIARNDFQAVCDSLVAVSTDSMILLYIDPVLWNQDNQITSDVMKIYTENSKLQKAEFVGRPVMSSEIDTMTYNQVTGKLITAYFRDNKIYRNDVDGNVQTIYYMQEDDSPEPVGLVSIQSGAATYYIDNNTVEGITYRNQPVFSIFPMDKIPETQALFLEDFKWEGHRRPVLREVFDRTIRPSERAEKSALPRPDFPITRRIEEYKTLLIESGTWVDRDDKLTPEALEWLHWLGY